MLCKQHDNLITVCGPAKVGVRRAGGVFQVREQLKSSAKRLGYTFFPDLTLKLLSARSRGLIEKQVASLRLDALARDVARCTEQRVAQGPFKGMRLDYEALPVHGAPKFLGTYEQELHPFIERMIALNPPFVLNVGCAEGFYAVGMALRLPNARIFAAEADPKSTKATMRNAELNAVADRITPVGIVKPGQLFPCMRQQLSAVIMDCEGAEFSLLNPIRDPILLRCHILVEVHPEFGSANEIVSRFSQTHSVTEIMPAKRELDGSSYPFDAAIAMDERSGEKSWLYLEASDDSAS